ncbi:MAG: hypothetical protein KGL95_03875, partial [Patescibacteria group bacterium]|nr:hypothetical protein [Patescibacteria group bacterium]
KYENLCIIHDRIVFDKEWYKGMKKWGNTFEHLSCQQLFNGHRAGDWCIVEDKYLTFKGKKSYFVSSLDYRDWYPSSFITGTMHIGKKSVLTNAWNETLYWNQAEDYTLTVDLFAKGVVPRFNDKMKVESLAWRFTIDTNVPFNSLSDTKIRKAPFIKLVGRNGMYYINKILGSDKMVAFAWKLFFEKNWFKKR